MFQCTHHTRRALIVKCFETLHCDFRSWKTSEGIINAVRAGAMAWIEGLEAPPVEFLNLPDDRIGRLVGKAYSDQSVLGWNVLFRGFWATSWRVAQEAVFLSCPSRDLTDTGVQWACKAQRWFTDLFKKVWKLRNEDEHGAELDAQRVIRLRKCERAIRRLYLKAEGLPRFDRFPFRDSIETLLEARLQDQELWITNAEGFMVKAFSRTKNRPRGQAAITSFFTRRL
jgi:hypothetical protein